MSDEPLERWLVAVIAGEQVVCEPLELLETPRRCYRFDVMDELWPALKAVLLGQRVLGVSERGRGVIDAKRVEALLRLFTELTQRGTRG